MLIGSFKDNTWNIRCLVNEMIVLWTQLPSILYLRLSDFKNSMTTLKFLFAHAHTKLAFLDPWYRTSLSHFYSETQLLQPRLTWIFQQLLISAPLCLHSFRQRKKRKELKNVALFLKSILLIWQNLIWQKISICECEICLHMIWKKFWHTPSCNVYQGSYLNLIFYQT